MELFISLHSCIFFIVLSLTSSYQDDTLPKDYILSDGIPVHKDDYAQVIKNMNQNKMIVDEDSLENEMESQLEGEEDKMTSAMFPNDCQVCRLVTEEIYKFLAEHGTIRKRRKGKEPIYKKSDDLIYKAMSELCSQMKTYTVTRIRAFRYIKGTTSLRRIFSKIKEESPNHHWFYNIPEHEIDDPTGEIRRLYIKCTVFIEDEEESIAHWFFESQADDLTKWLCQDKVLETKEDAGCLAQSTSVKRKYKEKTKQKKEKMKGKLPRHGKEDETSNVLPTNEIKDEKLERVTTIDPKVLHAEM